MNNFNCFIFIGGIGIMIGEFLNFKVLLIVNDFFKFINI